MKPIFFRTASFFFILSIVLTSNVFAQQRRALFETFSGEADPCNLSSQTTFESAVNSTVSQEGSKAVHLNYFLGNEPNTPYNLDAYGSMVDAALSGGNGSVIYTGAVDREVFNSTGVRIDPTTSGSYSDWGAAIDNDAGTTPEASITLNYATLNKSDSQNQVILHADMTVTANTTISDSLIIGYAITQDGVSFKEACGTSSTPVVVNDFVLYVSTSATNTNTNVVCTPSTVLNAGDTVHITWDHSIDVSDPLYENASKMKFVAFLQDQGASGSGNFFIANAAILKQDIDTLPPPPPTLVFNENFISGDTLKPGSTAAIYYTSTNLLNGVMVYYSLDDGATWRYIENSSSAYGPANWIVPDSLTTQGKIKLVAVGDTTLRSIEVGTFTIAIPPSVTILEPQNYQVIQGGSSDTIVWTNVSVTSNTLEYYLAEADGDFVTPHVLGTNLTDTFFVWAVPDTTRTVEIKLIPSNNEVPASVVIDTIESLVIIHNGVAENSVAPTGLTITNVYPNPASNGEEIVVQYSEPQPKPVTVQLLDLLGRVMPETYTTDDLAIHLNTSSLEAGAYVVRLSDGTNTVSKRVEIIR